MATKEAIRHALNKFEEELQRTETVKLTMAEYMKLLQIAQELDEDEPKEITVSWVETAPASEGE